MFSEDMDHLTTVVELRNMESTLHGSNQREQTVTRIAAAVDFLSAPETDSPSSSTPEWDSPVVSVQRHKRD